MPLTLPIEMRDRGVEVTDRHAFEWTNGKETDGITLTIELKTEEEAREVMDAIRAAASSLSREEESVATFEVETFGDVELTKDQVADELERIAKMLRDDYREGEVVVGETRGWWRTTAPST